MAYLAKSVMEGGGGGGITGFHHFNFIFKHTLPPILPKM